jgi:hypothetical protein
MKPSRDARTLEREAAAARAQARALHDKSVGEIGAENTRWGVRRDAALREAVAARGMADGAGKQAKDLYAERDDLVERAANDDRRGSQLYGEQPAAAEEHFENARGLTRMAESVSARADTARDLARAWDLKADALEAEAARIDREPMSADYRAPEYARAADLLDDKARLLEEAAQQARDAERYTADGDPGAASGSANWARYAQELADDIEPDYSPLDPQVLQDAGVPRSEIPGSELMDPTDPEPYAAMTEPDPAFDPMPPEIPASDFADDTTSSASWDEPTAYSDAMDA